MHAPSDEMTEIKEFPSALMQYALEREHGRQKGILWRRARALSKSFQTAVDESMFSIESVKTIRAAGRAFCDDNVTGTTTLVPVVRNAGIKRMLETGNLYELIVGLYEYLYDEATQVSILLFIAQYIDTFQIHHDIQRIRTMMSKARFHRIITGIMREHSNHKRLQRAGVKILYYLPPPDQTILSDRFAVYVVNTIAFAMQKFLKSNRIQRMGLGAISCIVQAINKTYCQHHVFTCHKEIDLLAIIAQSMTSQLHSLSVLQEFANVCSNLIASPVHTEHAIEMVRIINDRTMFSTGEKEIMNFVPVAENLMLTALECDARATQFITLENTTTALAWKNTSAHTTVIGLFLKIARTYFDELRQVDRIIQCVATTVRYTTISKDHTLAATDLVSLFLFETLQRYPQDTQRITAMQNTVFNTGIIRVVGDILLHTSSSAISCANCLKFLQLVCDVCQNNPDNYQKIKASNIVKLLIRTYGPRMPKESPEHPYFGHNFFDVVPLFEVRMMTQCQASWGRVLGLLERSGFV